MRRYAALSRGTFKGCCFNGRMQLQGMEATEILHNAKAAERKALAAAGEIHIFSR